MRTCFFKVKNFKPNVIFTGASLNALTESETCSNNFSIVVFIFAVKVTCSGDKEAALQGQDEPRLRNRI